MEIFPKIEYANNLRQFQWQKKRAIFFIDKHMEADGVD